QIIIFTAQDYLAIYNDAYAEILGSKHPTAFGRPAAVTWAETWAELEPILLNVLKTGETYSAKNRVFRVMRDGALKNLYFDVSFSVVREGPGSAPVAVLAIVNETTELVLSGRAERH